MLLLPHWRWIARRLCWRADWRMTVDFVFLSGRCLGRWRLLLPAKHLLHAVKIWIRELLTGFSSRNVVTVLNLGGFLRFDEIFRVSSEPTLDALWHSSNRLLHSVGWLLRLLRLGC